MCFSVCECACCEKSMRCECVCGHNTHARFAETPRTPWCCTATINQGLLLQRSTNGGMLRVCANNIICTYYMSNNNIVFLTVRSEWVQKYSSTPERAHHQDTTTVGVRSVTIESKGRWQCVSQQRPLYILQYFTRSTCLLRNNTYYAARIVVSSFQLFAPESWINTKYTAVDASAVEKERNSHQDISRTDLYDRRHTISLHTSLCTLNIKNKWITWWINIPPPPPISVHEFNQKCPQKYYVFFIFFFVGEIFGGCCAPCFRGERWVPTIRCTCALLHYLGSACHRLR